MSKLPYHLAALAGAVGDRHALDLAGDADARLGLLLARAARGEAGARVAGRDHDRDPLGGELGEVGVDDIDVGLFDPDLREVACSPNLDATQPKVRRLVSTEYRAA